MTAPRARTRRAPAKRRRPVQGYGWRNEDEFKDWVIDLAIKCGWQTNHQRPALTEDGRWVTAIQGHKGFPDLVAARHGVVVIRELKMDDGRVSPAQKAWLEQLGPMGGVWRSRDRELIIATFNQPRWRR